MKNRFFLAIAVIMVTGALLLTVTAQNPIVSYGGQRVGTYVYLQPDCSRNGDFFTFNVINNTNQTLPAGTKIFWSFNSTVKGSKVLSAALPAGQKTFLDSGPNLNTSGTPKAYFLK